MKEQLTAVEYIKEKLMCDEYWYENMTFDQIFEKAKEIEKEQNEKYNELKEVIENIIEHLDEGRVLTLRKDSIIVEELRNSINQ